MTMFNFTVIEGTLTKDPEIKDLVHYDGWKCTLEIACKTGLKTVMFKVILRDELAETCAKYLKKDSRVLVSGKLDRDIKTGKTIIAGKEVNFLTGKGGEKL